MENVDVFSHGFFQDILTLMKVLKTDVITKKKVQKLLDGSVKRKESGLTSIKKDRVKGK